MMQDLTDKKFGKLTVIQRLANNKHKKPVWLCICDCGNKKAIEGQSLRDGKTKSCGCLQKEITIRTRTKHGYAKRGKWSKIYRAWASMIQRCANQNYRYWKDYGGRGITVCERWLKFENFLEDMGEAPPGLTIDRIKNEKGYYKENCRWATLEQQARNTRKNRLITHIGKTQCVSAWSQEFDMDYMLLWQRLFRYNWSIKRALETPVRKGKKCKTKKMSV